MKTNLPQIISLLSPILFIGNEAIAKKRQPNIIVVIADDLGYGDVSAYGSTAVVTPSIDRLANEGIKFTNGHAVAATSTPSRFGLLTGEYPWRHNAFILPGDAPLIIDPQMETVPKLLKRAGYKTGAVGKWHLGMGDGNTNWNKLITPGASEVGFDYSYLMAATNDRVPTVYVRNGRVVNLDPADPISVSYKHNYPNEPEGRKNPEMLKLQAANNQHNDAITNGVPRIGYMKGGKSALWIDEYMAEVFLKEACNFVRSNKDKPFFLYYGLHQPHVPRVPNARFAGKSPLGSRGDVILEADWCVGEFLKVLDEEGLAENTIVIFTSDNGPILNDGYKDNAVELNKSHTPSGLWRGGKYSPYQGGTCVPFILRWPAKVSPKVSSSIVSHIDFYNSFARLTGQKDRKKDSEDVLDALLGKSSVGRKDLVLESLSGHTLIRQEEWVCIPATKKNPAQLFNLKYDPGQKQNVAEKYPQTVVEMIDRLNEITKNTKKNEYEK